MPPYRCATTTVAGVPPAGPGGPGARWLLGDQSDVSVFFLFFRSLIERPDQEPWSAWVKGSKPSTLLRPVSVFLY